MARQLASFRKLLPALAVGIVLGVSALLPSTSLGATTQLGYGYANNCGVKGDGFHDHGKPCPNRPFPGQGNGLSKFIQNVNQTSTSTETNVSHGSGGGPNGGNTPTTNVTSTSTLDEVSTTGDTKPGKHLGTGHHGGRNGRAPGNF